MYDATALARSALLKPQVKVSIVFQSMNPSQPTVGCHYHSLSEFWKDQAGGDFCWPITVVGFSRLPA